MSAPYSIGFKRAGVASVLSTINNTPANSESFLNFSMSSTESFGFARVSAKIAFVFGFTYFLSSSNSKS